MKSDNFFVNSIQNAVNRRKEKRKKIEAAALMRSSSLLHNGLNIKKEKKVPVFNSISPSSDFGSVYSSQNMSSSIADYKRKNSTFYYVHMFKEYDPNKMESVSKNRFLLSNSLSKFLNFWNESSFS